MEVLTIDFETYYDKEYSLSKLTTEEYVRSSHFEVILVGIRWPDGRTEVIDGTHLEIKHRFDEIEWGRYAVLCHNTLFDGAILAWRFGVNPAAWLDTLSMGRAMFGSRNNSLASLAKRYGLEDKGTFVQNMMGRRRRDISPGEFQQYAQYCLHDVELCHQLWQLMSNGWYNPSEGDNRGEFPLQELKLIDLHIRMFTEPMLRLNLPKLEAHLEDVLAHKAALMSRVTVDKAELMSNQKFAALLESMGVEVPMKISPTTGKHTFAFAKTDPGMKALLEHESPEVQALAAARLGIKSTLEETRTQRFIDIATRDPRFPVPLKYAYARTKRSSGGDGINLQNLPSRGNVGLKECIEAPPGWVVINCDSSNIEARMLAWWAGQDDLVQDFANGVDVYCKLATSIFGRPITKADTQERFVGKTVVLGCLAEKTLVLCERGWTPIEKVTTEDRLWDGLTWVHHQGLLEKGLKETLNIYGLWLTPDHQVLCGTEWKDAQSVLQDESSLSQILVTGAANLPLQATWRVPTGGFPNSSFGAIVIGQNTLWPKTTSSISEAPGATFAPLKSLSQSIARSIGRTQSPCQMMTTGNGYSIAYTQQSTDATKSPIETTKDMAEEVSPFVKNGERVNRLFSSTYRLLAGGIIQTLRWIELITIKAMNRATSDSYPEEKTSKTEGECTQCKSKSATYRKNLRTYDIALAGPNNRFTVLTAKGPVIVHNCGYQTGAGKLQVTLKAAKPSVDMPAAECERIINAYRSSVPGIVSLWGEGEKAIRAMYDNNSMWFGREGVVRIEGKYGVRLPSGLYISYPQLHRVMDNGRNRWQYKDDTGIVDLYGGKLVENVCQALARIIVMYQMLRIARKLPTKLTVHDSVVVLAREEEVEPARAYVEECMRWVPAWAKGCPINCESGVGRNYGEA